MADSWDCARMAKGARCVTFLDNNGPTVIQAFSQAQMWGDLCGMIGMLSYLYCVHPSASNI